MNKSSFTAFVTEQTPYNSALAKALRNFKQDISFSELNVGLLLDFENYLYSTQTISIDDIHSYFKELESCTALAVSKGFANSATNPFTEFQPKSTTQAITEDLERINW